MTGPRLRAVLATALVLLAGAGDAREFRRFSPIVTPEARPDDALPVARFVPVDRVLVERAVRALATAWNGGALDPLLDEDFVDGSRLRDVIAEVVPRDALLRVLGLEGVSTLDQYLRRDAQGRVQRVSTVVVVVLTQVEFNDPVTGFQRLQGRNELTFRVRQPDSGSGDAAP